MNKTLIIVIVVLILIVGGYFLFKGSYGVNSTVSSSPSTTTELNTVSIQNFSFQPATLTVKVGTTVTWKNNDSATHKIKSNTFNSSNLNNGDTYQFQFSQAGTFDYSCAIHPSMTGKIVVQQ